MIIIKNLRKEQPSNLWDIRIDRSSVLGNPYPLFSERNRNSVCEKYEQYFKKKLLVNEDVNFIFKLKKLKTLYKKYGKLNLFCWCAPKRCHAETIKKYLEDIQNERTIYSQEETKI